MSEEQDKQLLAAIQSGDLAGVKSALEAGANVNATNSYDNTALILSAYNESPEITAELLKHKPDLHKKFKNSTALDIAKSLNRQDTVDLLISAAKAEEAEKTAPKSPPETPAIIPAAAQETIPAEPAVPANPAEINGKTANPPAAEPKKDTDPKPLPTPSPAPTSPGAESENTPPQEGGGIGGFLQNNMGSIGIGLLAMIAAMFMGEMGLIGGLLIGLLAFGAAFALGGGMNNMFGDGQKKEPEIAKGLQKEIVTEPAVALEKEVDAPTAQTTNRYQVKSKDGQLMDGEGNIVSGDNRAEYIIYKDGQQAYVASGKLTVFDKKDMLIIDSMQAITPDGQRLPSPEGVFARIGLHADGNRENVIDFNSAELSFAKSQADKKLAEYVKPQEVALQVLDKADPSKVAAPIGTTKEGYTVELRGSRNGDDVHFTNVALRDRDGNEVVDSKRKTISPDIGDHKYEVVDGKVKLMSGQMADFTNKASADILTEKERDTAVAAKEKEKAKAEFVKDIAAQPDKESALIVLRDQYRERMVNSGVDKVAAAFIADEIKEKYKEGTFASLGKSGDSAAQDIAGMDKVKALKPEQRDALLDTVKDFHETSVTTVVGKTSSKPSVDVADGTDVVPSGAPVAKAKTGAAPSPAGG